MKRFDDITRRLRGAIAALLCTLAIAGCADAPGPAVGAPFPALDLPGLDREPLRFGELRGRVVVVNFWATWCIPCRDEMPSLQRLSERFEPGRLLVVGVTVDEDINLAREFLLKYGIDFPVALDPGGAVAQGILGVVGYPDTLIIAPDGVLAARFAGRRAWDGTEMVSFLTDLLPGES